MPCEKESGPLKISLISSTPEWKYLAEPLGVNLLKGQLLSSRKSLKLMNLDSQLERSVVKNADKMAEFHPDIIGFSLSPGGKNWADSLVREFFSNIEGKNEPLLVFGNVGATFSFEALLEEYPNALIVRGEGEDAIKGIVEFILNQRDKLTIPNLAYIEDGEIRFTEQKTVDLKTISQPDREESRKYLQRNIQVVSETSRGCKHTCTFCNRHAFFSNTRIWRGLPIDCVIADFERLSELGANGLTLADEDFFQGGLDRVQAIAKAIIASKKAGRISPNFQISLALRVDDVYSKKATHEKNESKRKALEFLKKAGLVWVFIGFESGSSGQLKRFGKTICPEESQRAISILEGLDIGIEGGFIMFDPLMTISELKQSTLFLKNSGVYKYISYPFSTLRAEPKTSMFNRLKSQGLISGPYDPSWIEYPIVYQDPLVAQVIQICHQWRRKTDILIPLLKAEYRQRVYLGNATSFETKLLFEYVKKSKLIFINFMEAVVWTIETEQGLDVINVVTENFNKKMLFFANNLLQVINSERFLNKLEELKKACADFINREG